MKKLIFTLLFIPVMAYSQTEKTENILTSGHCKVSCAETFINDSLVSAYVSLDAKDDRSASLQNYFTVCYDTPKNVCTFLSDLEKLSTGAAGTSSEISGHKVEIEKFSGTKDLKVWNESGLIFHRFMPEQVTSIKTRLIAWSRTRKITIE
jgi:hypothetical protein